MCDRHVFITGNRGYIGTTLTKVLKANGFEVSGYDIATDSTQDIRNLTVLTDSMRAAKPTTVIHLAAMSSVPACEDDIKAAISVNGQGTLNVLRAMKAVGCNNIIYTSTCAVYGKSLTKAATERDLLQPGSTYAFTKLLGEQAIYSVYNGTGTGNYYILRLFNVVGGTDCNVDRLFHSLKSGNIVVYGRNYNTKDGTCERDYVAVEDVCNACLKALQLSTLSQNREVLNICSGRLWSVWEIVELWQLHKAANLSVIWGKRRPGDVAKIYGSYNKAKRLLGWKPTRNLVDIIASM